ncbi:transposase [Shinella sp.]|uniref:transposase n=1 Tax=Shinella sp. TaxID=1870904 RepID=UPI003F6E74AE
MTKALVQLEFTMADEPNLDASTQAVEATPAAVPAETKKRRPPAKRKEAAAPVVTPAVSPSKSRRHSESEKAEKLAQIERRLSEGSTLKAAAADAGISDQTFYQWKRAVPTADAKPAATASQDDGLSDLLALEAENIRLRGLLAEKLRTENSALRKKLGLA